jgi:hypothetical protein
MPLVTAENLSSVRHVLTPNTLRDKRSLPPLTPSSRLATFTPSGRNGSSSVGGTRLQTTNIPVTPLGKSASNIEAPPTLQQATKNQPTTQSSKTHAPSDLIAPVSERHDSNTNGFTTPLRSEPDLPIVTPFTPAIDSLTEQKQQQPQPDNSNLSSASSSSSSSSSSSATTVPSPEHHRRPSALDANSSPFRPSLMRKMSDPIPPPNYHSASSNRTFTYDRAVELQRITRERLSAETVERAALANAIFWRQVSFVLLGLWCAVITILVLWFAQNFPAVDLEWLQTEGRSSMSVNVTVRWIWSCSLAVIFHIFGFEVLYIVLYHSFKSMTRNPCCRRVFCCQGSSSSSSPSTVPNRDMKAPKSAMKYQMNNLVDPDREPQQP